MFARNSKVAAKDEPRPPAFKTNRQYENWDDAKGADPLPTLEETALTPAEHRALLLSLYSEVCSTWRTLVDVRFKLVALLPAASIGGLLLISGPASGETTSAFARGGAAVAGLLTTIALWLYETRNSELHDDLVDRGRRIEKELGVANGQFLGRLKSKNWALSFLPVKHDFAIRLVYATSAAAWLVGLAFAIDN